MRHLRVGLLSFPNAQCVQRQPGPHRRPVGERTSLTQRHAALVGHPAQVKMKRARGRDRTEIHNRSIAFRPGARVCSVAPPPSHRFLPDRKDLDMKNRGPMRYLDISFCGTITSDERGHTGTGSNYGIIQVLYFYR